MSAEDGRPTAGFLNWCEGVAELESLSNFPHLVDTAIHEILHAMGFSRPLFSLFREADGSPVSGADMLLRWPVGPENATAVRTPSVSLAAALHFACYPEPGVALETAGGGSTVGSHWSQLVVPVSRLTLGAMLLGQQRARNNGVHET